MPSTTRDRILDAAHALIEQRGAAAMRLEDVGRAAGVSRQTVYLHFGSRPALLRELMAHVDRRTALHELAEPVRAAPDALAELEAFIRLQAQHNPRIVAVGRAIDAARRDDAALGEAWDVALAERRAACRRIVDRLAGEGLLAARWTDRAAAADVLHILTALRTWDELCNDLGWSSEDYRERVLALARSALLA